MANFQTFLVKKCFEISYALGRLAANCASFDFSRHLQKDSLELIEKAHFSDCGEVDKILSSINHKLRIGLEMGFVSDQNFQVLNGEIIKLTTVIEEYVNSDNAKKDGAIDIRGIFSEEKFEAVVSEQNSVDSRSNFFSDKIVNSGLSETEETAKFSRGVRFDIDSLLPANKDDSKDVSAVIGGEMRQSAILGKIRQSGYCRLKEIQEIIPESSERTLRYDLQKLIDKGSVERVGSGGPASFYRMRRSSGNK